MLTNMKSIFAVTGLLAVFAIAGCSDRTQDAAQDTAASAGKDVTDATKATGEAVGGAVDATGKAVGNAAENAGEAVGGAVTGVAKETQDAAQSATLTPKVKNALVADKSINASTIDVDTSGENDTVVLKGMVRSEAEKKKAEQVARKVLTDSGSTFKLRNDLAVGKM